MVVLALLFAVSLGSACDDSSPEDPGNQCQPNGVCPAGFTCNAATNICVPNQPDAFVATMIDGGTTVDASALDAPPGAVDASALDAPPGAVDAATTPDAAPAALALSPMGQDFGSVTLGGAAPAVTFTVTNSGALPSATLTVTVSDPTFALSADTCTRNALGGGATCTFAVTFNPTGVAGARTATLSVTGLSEVALTGTAVTPGQLVAAPATKDFGPIAIGATSPATTVTITNSGQSATGVPAVALSSTSQFAISSNTCTAALPASGTCAVGVQFKPTSVGRKQGVTLNVSSDPGGTIPIALQGTGTAQLTVTNPGGGTITSAPAGITCGATCTATFTASPVVLTAVPDATHTFTGWSGACTGTGGCSVALDAATKTVTPAFTVIPMADVRVTGAASSAVHGQSFTYTFTLRNAGPDDATGVALVDTLPAGTTFVSGSAGCSASGPTVTCAVGALANGGMAQVSIVANAASVGSIRNTATVSAAQTDPDASNNSASVDTTVAPVADLSITSLAGAPNPGIVGANTTYTIAFHNAGLDSATTVVATDTLDSTMTFVSATSGQGTCSHVGTTVTCNLGTMASGANASVTVVGKPTAAGSIGNSATIASAVADPVGTNNSSTTSVTIAALNTLSVTLTGTGTVSSTPAGITGCTSNCSAGFAPGTTVTLTAKSGLGFRFNGWGGACTGIVRNGCTVTMSAARSVTASFVAQANNLVFVSSVTYPANLGGATAYDTKCNELATAAGLNTATNDGYISWMSDANSLMTSRMGSARGFIRVDGAPFGDEVAHFASECNSFNPDPNCKVLNAITLDENGREVRANVFTGFTLDGTSTASKTCTNWTSTTTATPAAAGVSDGGPNWWHNRFGVGCTELHPVYCFMKAKTNALTFTPATGPTVKKIFVANYSGGSDGIAGADADCAAAKPAGTGSVVALLPLVGPPARSASSLLSPSVTYVRPDGIAVGTGAELEAGVLHSGVWQYGPGDDTSYDITFVSLLGTSDVTAVPTGPDETCSDWTATSGPTSVGIAGTLSSWWPGLDGECGGGVINCIEQ